VLLVLAGWLVAAAAGREAERPSPDASAAAASGANVVSPLVIPVVRRKTPLDARVHEVELLTIIAHRGGVWLADPFFESDSQAYALIQFARGEQELEYVRLPSIHDGSVSAAVSQGGGWFPHGAIVGTRIQVVRQPPGAGDEDREPQEWRMRSVLSGQAAQTRSEAPRALGSERQAVHSDWVALGRSRQPFSTRRLPRDPFPAERPNPDALQADLAVVGSPEAPPQSVALDLTFANCGPHALQLFDPFLAYEEGIRFPARLLCGASEVDGESPRDLFERAVYVSASYPTRQYCFSAPGHSVCGARRTFRRNAPAGRYEITLEVDERFVCDGRPVDKQGVFLDVRGTRLDDFRPFRSASTSVELR